MKKKKKKNYLGENFWSLYYRKVLWVNCRHSITTDKNNIENKKILQNFGPGFFFFPTTTEDNIIFSSLNYKNKARQRPSFVKVFSFVLVSFFFYYYILANQIPLSFIINNSFAYILLWFCYIDS